MSAVAEPPTFNIRDNGNRAVRSASEIADAEIEPSVILTYLLVKPSVGEYIVTFSPDWKLLLGSFAVDYSSLDLLESRLLPFFTPSYLRDRTRVIEIATIVLLPPLRVATFSERWHFHIGPLRCLFQHLLVGCLHRSHRSNRPRAFPCRRRPR